MAGGFHTLCTPSGPRKRGALSTEVRPGSFPLAHRPAAGRPAQLRCIPWRTGRPSRLAVMV